MTTPAVREPESPLEAVLLDVDAILADLLVAADEQHAAVVAGDRELQPRHARNGSLLERSAELAGQTVLFLQRVASPPSPSYGAHGRRAPQQSLLVDRRA
jgi:hypothetical protein